MSACLNGKYDAILPPTLWLDVVGDEPERWVKQRALPLMSESGRFADGTLRLTTLPSRIDWVYEAVGLRTDVVEAVNGNIKSLMRRGRGYRNLRYLLLKAQRIAVAKTEFVVFRKAA